jgi:hypothetical protein
MKGTPMDSAVHLPRPCPSREATARDAENVAHIGRRNSAGLFYAACSRDYDEEICGCPICQQAARDGK